MSNNWSFLSRISQQIYEIIWRLLYFFEINYFETIIHEPIPSITRTKFYWKIFQLDESRIDFLFKSNLNIWWSFPIIWTKYRTEMLILSIAHYLVRLKQIVTIVVNLDKMIHYLLNKKRFFTNVNKKCFVIKSNFSKEKIDQKKFLEKGIGFFSQRIILER